MAKSRRKSKVHCKFGKLKNPKGSRVCRRKRPGRRSRK